MLRYFKIMLFQIKIQECWYALKPNRIVQTPVQILYGLPVHTNISQNHNRIPFPRRRHLRTFGLHSESRIFYFPLHFTHNQKHVECFICRLEKQIKQAILCWKELILPVDQDSSSVSKLPSSLLSFPCLEG